MDVRALLYILFYISYFAKGLAQGSIFFVWLADSTSESIQYIAGVVTLLAIGPFFHVTDQVSGPTLAFSATLFKSYLCYSAVLDVLWFVPTRHGVRIIPLSIVSILDSLSLIIFLYFKSTIQPSGPSVTDEEHGIDKARSKVFREVPAREEITGMMHGALDGQDVENHARFSPRDGITIRPIVGSHAREPGSEAGVQADRERLYREYDHQRHQGQQQEKQRHRERHRERHRRTHGKRNIADFQERTHRDELSSLVLEEEEAAVIENIPEDQQMENLYDGPSEMIQTRRGAFPLRIIPPNEQHPAIRGSPEIFETPVGGVSPPEEYGEGKL